MSDLSPNPSKAWLNFLSEEDLAFIRNFILASGSLKELALVYGVSYPTLRLRLDRLIEKIKIAEAHQSTSHFERTLRALYAEGKIEMETLRTLLAAHKLELENQGGNQS
ncbi:MAG: DUF2089 family protein [Acidobacteria bacterium]|nr:DUF2089 family protein [Acidobacteriota bacterium]